MPSPAPTPSGPTLTPKSRALGKFPAKFAKMLPNIRYSMTGIIDFSEASAVVTSIVEAVEGGQSVPSVMSQYNSKFQSYLPKK